MLLQWEGEMDVMTVEIETENNDPEVIGSSIISILKLKGIVELVSPDRCLGFC